jgi:hypothetical protein
MSETRSLHVLVRETACPILRMTVDHDKNFGGGALAEATKGSEPA